MKLRQKYILDINDLQYKQIRLPWRKKLLKFTLWLAASVVVTILYGTIIESIFGSPKEELLNKKIEDIKLHYSLTAKELNNSLEAMNRLKLSDEIRYRPILRMDSIPSTFRNPAFGGIDRFRDLNGYSNSLLMKSTRTTIEELKNMINVQSESFITIGERTTEWKFEMDHLPAISPVDPSFRLGDGLRFRDVHPVLGIGKMHYGQDFYVPYGTKIYATGDGKVIQSGWNSGGFGNVVIIDHSNGLQSIYGHLSAMSVSVGTDRKSVV